MKDVCQRERQVASSKSIQEIALKTTCKIGLVDQVMVVERSNGWGLYWRARWNGSAVSGAVRSDKAMTGIAPEHRLPLVLYATRNVAELV